MFGLIKYISMGLLINMINVSNNTKCVLVNNQKCMIQPTLINFHPNEYSQEFHEYPFSVKLGRPVGSCNTLNDFSNKVCIPNKIIDLNLSVFDMGTGISELKILTKHVLCEYKCRFNGKNVIQTNGEMKMNVDVSVRK